MTELTVRSDILESVLIFVILFPFAQPSKIRSSSSVRHTSDRNSRSIILFHRMSFIHYGFPTHLLAASAQPSARR